jgi:hypothetical protein
VQEQNNGITTDDLVMELGLQQVTIIQMRKQIMTLSQALEAKQRESGVTDDKNREV